MACIYLTHSAAQKVCVSENEGKIRYTQVLNWEEQTVLSPRLYTKSKKYLPLQVNTTVGSLM